MASAIFGATAGAGVDEGGGVAASTSVKYGSKSGCGEIATGLRVEGGDTSG